MVCFAPPPLLLVYPCANVGPQGLSATTLWGLPARAWPVPLHNLPLRWVCQPPPCCESSPPQLPVSAPPSGLDECFFLISLVVGLPYSSYFCQFWLFFALKLFLSFFWLCEEAQCVYLRVQVGQKLRSVFPIVIGLKGSIYLHPLKPNKTQTGICSKKYKGLFSGSGPHAETQVSQCSKTWLPDGFQGMGYIGGNPSLQ